MKVFMQRCKAIIKNPIFFKEKKFIQIVYFIENNISNVYVSYIIHNHKSPKPLDAINTHFLYIVS